MPRAPKNKKAPTKPPAAAKDGVSKSPAAKSGATKSSAKGKASETPASAKSAVAKPAIAKEGATSLPSAKPKSAEPEADSVEHAPAGFAPQEERDGPLVPRSSPGDGDDDGGDDAVAAGNEATAEGAAAATDGTAATGGAEAPKTERSSYRRSSRFQPPPLIPGTQILVIARAKYTVVRLPNAIEVSRPRKRDPENPRTYRFSLKGLEIARKHMAGRSVTLADANELLKAVKVPELEVLEGEARKVATKFLLVALSSREEATLDKDGDLILVRVPFNSADLA